MPQKGQQAARKQKPAQRISRCEQLACRQGTGLPYLHLPTVCRQAPTTIRNQVPEEQIDEQGEDPAKASSAWSPHVSVKAVQH
mmetsp:Transcript_5450/g.12001  ORF Transcript_5450/g.12001 Transcript_5450/m.12001 type:complete len:83 (-) Transcript_5450:444-692(-)